MMKSSNIGKVCVNGMSVVEELLVTQGRIAADEVWVHGMWTPGKWLACIKAKLAGKKLVRMTHGSLSPIYLERQGMWKKRLVKPIEKLLFRMADKIVFTGLWEKEWFERWMKGQEAKFEIIDLKRFFDLSKKIDAPLHAPLRLMYLGRRHPLKGVECLEEAVKRTNVSDTIVQLKEVTNHSGDELEKDWEWCDVLCLPTLSENFGLVVAEALERGKKVITTDGAPAWADYPGVSYIRGYKEADSEAQIQLLQDGILKCLKGDMA